MPIIDPNKAPEGTKKRLDGETNPYFRRMLEEVIYHNAVEGAGDIDKALNRLAPQCEYILYRADEAPVTISGIKEIRKRFYDDMFDIIGTDLEWDVVSCLVDDHQVITEGRLKVAVRGTYLASQGLDADPEKFYLRQGRHLVVWPFDAEYRPIGETVWYGPLQPLSEVLKQPLKPEDIGRWTSEVVLPTELPSK